MTAVVSPRCDYRFNHLVTGPPKALGLRGILPHKPWSYPARGRLRAVRALPDLVVTGSMGQPRMHPLLSELRAHRVLLERLTTALNLPDEWEESGLRPGQRHAQRAAQGRWKDHVPNAKLAELRGEAS
jgi:hypothetical protein